MQIYVKHVFHLLLLFFFFLLLLLCTKLKTANGESLDRARDFRNINHKHQQTTFFSTEKMYGKENATSPVIVLAKCPPLEELLTISICITKSFNNTSSTFQPHVIRCRQVFTIYDCIK